MQQVVKILEVNGQELPVSFGLNAVRIFCKETGLKISQLDAISDDFDLSLRLAYTGVKEGHRVAGEKFDHEFEDFCDMLGDDWNALGRILEAFAESLPSQDEKNVPAAKGKPQKN